MQGETLADYEEPDETRDDRRLFPTNFLLTDDDGNSAHFRMDCDDKVPGWNEWVH